MGLRHLMLRFKGQYDKKNRDEVEKAIPLVRSLLNSTLSETLKAFLELQVMGLEQKRRTIILGTFIGGRLARKLSCFAPKRDSYYTIFRKAFQNGDKFSINNIHFPLIESLSDQSLFIYEFIDILGDTAFPNDDLTSLYNEGPYELGNVRLQEGNVVLDCGANMGMFSALASSKGCKVYAFEPIQYIIGTYLTKTAELNDNITICPYALSDKEQELTFQINETNLGASRFLEKNTKDLPTQKVSATTLDQFVAKANLDRVDFIKADIEGAERYMLQGATETIRRFGPKLSICTYHLPDDPEVLSNIILKIQPKYKITFGKMKLYASLD